MLKAASESPAAVNQGVRSPHHWHLKKRKVNFRRGAYNTNLQKMGPVRWLSKSRCLPTDLGGLSWIPDIQMAEEITLMSCHHLHSMSPQINRCNNPPDLSLTVT